MLEGKRLVVTTPWYPVEGRPYDGIFVQESVAALGHPAELTTIVHVRNVPPGAEAGVTRSTTPYGELVRIDLPVDPMSPRVDTARLQREALRRADLPELRDADVVHAHVGMPTGWAVSGLLRPDQQLVVTEHATYLRTVLRLPEGAKLYGELMRRAQWYLAVSELEARRVRGLYPELGSRVRVIANPVDDERFTLRERTPTSLDRWVFVGNLIERKGVTTLVRAFAQWADERPRTAHLTLVGGGPDRDELVALVAELGLQDKVTFHGHARPDDLPGIFAEHDVLVHLSAFETFGLTVVEAAMSGLPVVVTTSSGPQETLSDAAASGMAEYVGLPATAEGTVTAVHRLEDALPTADAAAVREVLVSRYGAQHYGERLRRALAGRPPVPAPAADAPLVLCLASTQLAARRLVRVQSEALRAGARVALVTAAENNGPQTEPYVDVLDLGPQVHRGPAHLVPHVIVDVVPKTLVRGVRRGCTLVASTSTPLRAPAQRGVNLTSKVLSKHHQLARRVETVLDRRVYSHIGPARIARHVVDEHGAWLDAHVPDVIVMGDEASVPLAWRLAQRYPDAEIVGAVSDAVVRDLVATARERAAAATQGPSTDPEPTAPTQD